MSYPIFCTVHKTTDTKRPSLRPGTHLLVAPFFFLSTTQYLRIIITSMDDMYSRSQQHDTDHYRRTKQAQLWPPSMVSICASHRSSITNTSTRIIASTGTIYILRTLPQLVNPILVTRLRRHYSGQPAPFNRRYRGATTTTTVVPLRIDEQEHVTVVSTA